MADSVIMRVDPVEFSLKAVAFERFYESLTN